MEVAVTRPFCAGREDRRAVRWKRRRKKHVRLRSATACVEPAAAQMAGRTAARPGSAERRASSVASWASAAGTKGITRRDI